MSWSDYLNTKRNVDIKLWDFDCLHFAQYIWISPHGIDCKQTWCKRIYCMDRISWLKPMCDKSHDQLVPEWLAINSWISSNTRSISVRNEFSPLALTDNFVTDNLGILYIVLWCPKGFITVYLIVTKLSQSDLWVVKKSINTGCAESQLCGIWVANYLRKANQILLPRWNSRLFWGVCKLCFGHK